MQTRYPTRDIWGMFPTTTWIVEVRPKTMEVDPADFGQAHQGLMLGQTVYATGQQQYVPVGQTTQLEVQEKPDYMKAPAIEWGGIHLGQVPVVVKPFDDLAARYGIEKEHPFSGIGLKPLGLGRAFLGQVPLRMGQFEAAPIEEGNPGVAWVNPLELAYTTGAYIRAGAPEWGRFPTLPAGITYRV